VPKIRRKPPRSDVLAVPRSRPTTAATKPIQLFGRYQIYNHLETIYCIYVKWKKHKVAKQSARNLADKLDIPRRKGMSPIRVLIESRLGNADFKQKSRWTRALEYLAAEEVRPERFRRYVRAHGGLAGCADLAVDLKRKRRRTWREAPEGDWTD
jgi:hypothetical protein